MAKKFKLKVIFGESAVKAFDENPRITQARLNELGSVSKVCFDTEEEMNAYTQGLMDAVGWHEVDWIQMKK